jgi:hypothetical protein
MQQLQNGAFGMTTKTNSRAVAGLRIHRNHVARMIGQIKNRVAKRALVEALAAIDAELPAKVEKPVRATDRKVSALRAHRTMVARKMKGATKSVRTELAAKLAAYDKLISEAA